jgi:16S rRNA (cytosine1402-N4)-methyltransferase
MKRDTRHVPVLLDPVLDALRPRPGQVFVDCTTGLGGHAAAVLARVQPGGMLIGIDFDPANLGLARAKLEAVPASGGGRFALFHNNFAGLPAVLAEAGVERVDGLVADLGVASPQIDDPERGFSYKRGALRHAHGPDARPPGVRPRQPAAGARARRGVLRTRR